MKQSRLVWGPLCGLLALWVLSSGSATGEVRRPPDRVELSDCRVICEHIRRHGVFNHPSYPLVVRARLVKGTTLYLIQFLRRDASGKGFDLVGKARMAALRPGILLTRYGEAAFADGSRAIWDTKDFEFKMPKVPRFLVRLTEGFAEVEQRLTAAQKAFLAWNLIESQEDRKVVDCFGERSEELISHFSERRALISLHWILLANDPVEDGKRFLLPNCSIGLPDHRTGKLVPAVRHATVWLSFEDYQRLGREGVSAKGITVHCPDGRRLVLPSGGRLEPRKK